MWAGYRDKEEWRKIEKVIAGCGGNFQNCHSSGHANREELLSFVNSIAAKVVVPIHTSVPELFPCLFPNCVRLADGDVMEV